MEWHAASEKCPFRCIAEIAAALAAEAFARTVPYVAGVPVTRVIDLIVGECSRPEILMNFSDAQAREQWINGRYELGSRGRGCTDFDDPRMRPSAIYQSPRAPFMPQHRGTAAAAI